MKKMLLLTLIAVTIISVTCILDPVLKEKMNISNLKTAQLPSDWNNYLSELDSFGSIFIGTIQTVQLEKLRKALKIPQEMPYWPKEKKKQTEAFIYYESQMEYPYIRRHQYIAAFLTVFSITKYAIGFSVAEGKPKLINDKKSVRELPPEDRMKIEKIIREKSLLEIAFQMKEIS